MDKKRKDSRFLDGGAPSGGQASHTPLWESASGTGGLAADILADASGRLKVLGAVSAGIWVFYILFGSVIRPLTIGSNPALKDPQLHSICAVGALLSLGMYFLARSSRLDPKRLMTVGLFYVALTALLIAMVYLTMHIPTYEEMLAGERQGVSWVCIWILVFPLIVPTTPGRTLFAAILSAIMDPVVFTIYSLLSGTDLVPFFPTLFWWVDNYICALLAMIPAHIVCQLGEKVREARQMGSYRLIELIGKGGMGEVWRAEHNMLARPAAIKIIRPDSLGASNREVAELTLRRFEREAQATAKLESPHTIQLYDFDLSRDGTFYFVMELLSGYELDNLIRRFGPIPPERTIAILKQICHSLSDAHNSGLIHRDIKPANIFICRKGEDFDFVKVLDFGLVKSTGATEEMAGGETMEGITTGTPSFMAPEQATGDTPPDGRVDIYAVGCVGYWLLTGSLLFEADSAMKMILKHVQEIPDPPSIRSELDIPESLDRVIMQCLEKDPNKRPASARELTRLLDSCATENKWDEHRAETWWKTHSPDRA